MLHCVRARALCCVTTCSYATCCALLTCCMASQSTCAFCMASPYALSVCVWARAAIPRAPCRACRSLAIDCAGIIFHHWEGNQCRKIKKSFFIVALGLRPPRLVGAAPCCAVLCCEELCAVLLRSEIWHAAVLFIAKRPHFCFVPMSCEHARTRAIMGVKRWVGSLSAPQGARRKVIKSCGVGGAGDRHDCVVKKDASTTQRSQ